MQGNQSYPTPFNINKKAIMSNNRIIDPSFILLFPSVKINCPKFLETSYLIVFK